LLARSKVVDVDVYELLDDDDSELVWPPPDGFLDMVDPELAKEILASEEAELAQARLASKVRHAWTGCQRISNKYYQFATQHCAHDITHVRINERI
jgi:hypothetical protein